MKRFKDKRKVISLTLVGIAYALIVMPLIASNIQKHQLRSQTIAYQKTHVLLAQNAKKASVLAAATCKNATADIMLVMDTSDSMNEKIGSTGSTKLAAAEAAAKNFLDIIKNEQNNSRVGLVTFDATASLKSGYTTNFTALKSIINTLPTKAHTCMQCGIDKANTTITAQKRPNVKTVIVLITDGLAINVEGNPNYVPLAQGEAAAAKAAADGSKTNKTSLYTIGLGKDVDGAFLRKLASDNGGIYFFSPTTAELNKVYTDISNALGKGVISGFVFNDANASASFDTGEAKLSGWTINLALGTNKQTTTTATDGTYSFSGLCDGQYQLSQTMKSGWTQTLPKNTAGYTPVITDANHLTDNFGDTTKPKPSITPTATPVPTGTTMNMTVFLDGIGNRGDNTNPSSSSFSNKNPQHDTTKAIVQVYSVGNTLVDTGTGTLNYDATLGAYTGNIPLTTSKIIKGNYIIKVKTDSHLQREIDSFQPLAPNANNIITPVALVAGDISNQNKLNVLDYNMILSCFADSTTNSDCLAPSTDTSNGADLNDDGVIDGSDLNLFLRELLTQPGN